MSKFLLAAAVSAVCLLGIDVASATDIKGRFSISPFGGASIPIGGFGDADSANADAGGAKTGFVFGASVEYGVSETIAIGGRFAYHRFGVDRKIFGSELPDSVGLDADWTIMEIFGAHVKYVAMPGQSTRPYGRAGFFIGKPKLSIEYDSVDTEYKSDAAFGIDLSIGVTHMISKRFGGFVEGRFAHLFAKDVAVMESEYNKRTAAEYFSSPVGIRDPGGNRGWLDLQSGIVIVVY